MPLPGTIDKLIGKGKAKLKEFSGNSAHQSYGQPAGQYPGQYQPNQYNQPPHQYQQNQPPHQYPPYTGPPTPQGQQWGPPQPQGQPQWQPPPNQWGGIQQPQQPFSPPIPQQSKPQYGQPNSAPSQSPQPQSPHVTFSQPHSPQGPVPPFNRPVPVPETYGDPNVYWQPNFDVSVPVTQNFRHELGDHGWGNNEKQNYTDNPANSFHHDNRLIVRGLVQNGTYTSARLTSHRTLARPRGYLTATIMAPCAEGIWPAYWMLPQDPFSWPTDGEIDIFESWNGDCKNHSCLHWGNYNGEDWNKHRVIDTHIADMPSRPHVFGFAWMEEEGVPGWRGRMIWYVDGRPVMKAEIPNGTRRMEDYRILINLAMGGNVCGGKLPREGYYDLVVSDLKMCNEPVGGWEEFERAWNHTPEGKTM